MGRLVYTHDDNFQVGTTRSEMVRTLILGGVVVKDDGLNECEVVGSAADGWKSVVEESRWGRTKED